MANVWIICRRELAGYFGTPIAYVFLAIFVFLSGIFAFYIGNFFEGGQANLQSFFVFHPWLYLFLIPALSMRLWAEERRAGTIELLFTLPVTMVQAVIGKFLAAWAFHRDRACAHLPALDHRQLPRRSRQRRRPRRLPRQPADGRRVPRHRLVHLRPDPQPGHRLRGERRGVPGLRAERLSAGARIRRRAGFPAIVVDAVRSFSFLTHFQAISKGVLQAGDVVYFVSLIVFWLFVNAVVIEWRKAM